MNEPIIAAIIAALSNPHFTKDAPASFVKRAGRLLVQAIDEGAWSGPEHFGFVDMVRHRAAQTPPDNGLIAAWSDAIGLLRGKPNEPHVPEASFSDDRKLVIEALEAQLQAARTIPVSDGNQSGTPSAPPLVHLASWRDILLALGMKNNKEDKKKVSRLNKSFCGPIVTGSRGKQPFVDKGKLIAWWDGLEARVQAENRARDSAASAADKYKYGVTAELAPNIGAVKIRRKDFKT